MNPWAVILALIAVGCLIVAYKGTQDNLFTAISGKSVGNQTLTPSTTTPPLVNGGGFNVGPNGEFNIP